MMGFEI